MVSCNNLGYKIGRKGIMTANFLLIEAKFKYQMYKDRPKTVQVKETRKQ